MHGTLFYVLDWQRSSSVCLWRVAHVLLALADEHSMSAATVTAIHCCCCCCCHFRVSVSLMCGLIPSGWWPQDSGARGSRCSSAMARAALMCCCSCMGLWSPTMCMNGEPCAVVFSVTSFITPHDRHQKDEHCSFKAHTNAALPGLTGFSLQCCQSSDRWQHQRGDGPHTTLHCGIFAWAARPSCPDSIMACMYH